VLIYWHWGARGKEFEIGVVIHALVEGVERQRVLLPEEWEGQYLSEPGRYNPRLDKRKCRGFLWLAMNKRFMH
jgi:hypothetical protein